MSEVVWPSPTDNGRVPTIEMCFSGVAPCPHCKGGTFILWHMAGREITLERLTMPIIKDGHVHYYRVHERTARAYSWLWDGYRMEG